MGGANLAGSLLAPLLNGDARRPRLICYGAGDTAGARTELSGRTLANWTAKVAGLLCDELGATPGDTVSVLIPAEWQTAPILLGAWWAGLVVSDTDDPDAVAAFVPPGGDASADEVFMVSGHPLGAPSTDMRPHHRDFTLSTLPQADRLTNAAAVGAEATAVRTAAGTESVAAMLDRSRAAAGQLTGVLLSLLDWTLPDGVAATLLAALAADCALVHCAPGLDAQHLAAIAAAEKVTATAGVDLPGLPRAGWLRSARH